MLTKSHFNIFKESNLVLFPTMAIPELHQIPYPSNLELLSGLKQIIQTTFKQQLDSRTVLPLFIWTIHASLCCHIQFLKTKPNQMNLKGCRSACQLIRFQIFGTNIYSTLLPLNILGGSTHPMHVPKECVCQSNFMIHYWDFPNICSFVLKSH